jgi:hypothetical protein
MLPLILWFVATTSDPAQMFVYELAGCKTDCAAETQAFADSGAVYLAVNSRSLLLEPNGEIEIHAPTPALDRRIIATLPRREAAAIFKVVDDLKDKVNVPHKQWLDKPSSLDAEMVTIAFGVRGKMHFVQKSAMYLSHDYYTLIATLLPYLDGDALVARAKSVRIEKVPEKPQMYSRIGNARTERWHAEGLAERVVTTQETIDRTKTNLRGFRIVHDAPEHLTLQFDFDYDGSHGDAVLTCVSAFDNNHDSHTGCRPNVVRKGRSVACAMIIASQDSPESFETTTLEVPLYERGTGHVFYTVRLPMWKTWKRAPKNFECAQCNAQCLK